jgi:hypothetical protein
MPLNLDYHNTKSNTYFNNVLPNELKNGIKNMIKARFIMLAIYSISIDVSRIFFNILICVVIIDINMLNPLTIYVYVNVNIIYITFIILLSAELINYIIDAIRFVVLSLKLA